MNTDFDLMRRGSLFVGNRGAVVRTVVVAVLLVVMWGVISLDGNAEQEAFNRGGIYLTAGLAAVYVRVSFVLLRRAPISGRGEAFVRWGGLVMMVGAEVLYFVVASVLARRVM
jgi:hypothetical protein